MLGCTLEPHYQRPQPAIAPQWPEPPAPAAAPAAAPPAAPRAAAPQTPASAAETAAAASDIGWRDFFEDTTLQKLIELALRNNPDARVAALNVAAAQAQYQIQRASLFPAISADGVGEFEKYPASVATLASSGSTAGGGGAAVPTVSGSSVFRYFDVGVGFTSYELDLFGKLRSLDHERLQQYLGYIETRRSAQISVVAEVASAYLTLLADRKLLKITRDTLDSQQDSLKLIQMSFDGGVDTALDLNQAKTTVATAQANLAQYERQVAQDQNALIVLLGVPLPADLPLTGELDSERLLADLPAGMPSEVLTRRPDILAAERNLIAANANIGAARAAFFPSISLTGNFGTASTQLSGLFQRGSSTWTFAPQISVPIFAGGANVAGLHLATTQRDILTTQYQQSIQSAFREVSDALAGRGTLDRQLIADQALVDASAESYRLSDMRFTNGVDNYLAVLDSQRSLYSAQQSLVDVQLARLENLVTLYKSLGGGWRERSAPNTAGGAP
jgi:multidrug efflux system outer membrane protein